MVTGFGRLIRSSVMLAGLTASWVSAEVISIAQAAKGANTGADSSNAHSVIWFNTSANWGVGAGKIGAGDTALLTGIFTSSINILGHGEAGAPITILFAPNARFSNPTWPAGTAIITANAGFGGNYVIIDGGENGTIEATDNGTALTHHNHFQAVSLNGVRHTEVKNLAILNLYVRTPNSNDSLQNGTSINGDGINDVAIHHNTITECRTAIRCAYRPGCRNLRVYNNTITRVSNGMFIGSANSNCTLDTLVIHHNRIIDFFNWDGSWNATSSGHHHSDGIQISAPHSGAWVDQVTVHSNVIGGNTGYFLTGTLYMEDDIRTSVVYNNLFYTTGDNSPTNAFIGPGTPALVYNNTVCASAGGIGIGARGAESKIFNNILYNVEYGISTQNDNRPGYCDYNLYVFKKDREMYLNPYVYRYDRWRMELGYDAHSIEVNPLFVDTVNHDYRLQATSPARDTGTTIAGMAATDLDGNPRPAGSRCDLGAYEYTVIGIQPVLPAGRTGQTAWSRLPNPLTVSALRRSVRDLPGLTIHDLSGNPVRVGAIANTGVYLLRNSPTDRLRCVMIIK